MKALCQEEWLNCLVSKEENVAGEGSILLMEDITYVVKRNSYTFLSAIMNWILYIYYCKSTQLLGKMDVQRGK